MDLTWYKMATEAEPTDVLAPPPEEQPIFTSRFGWGGKRGVNYKLNASGQMYVKASSLCYPRSECTCRGD